MDILGVGFPELVLIFIIAMMVFGPRRLPEIVAKVAKTIRDLRAMSQGLMTEWQREITVATRLDELQAAREDIENVKQELKQTQESVAAETSSGLQDVRKELKQAEQEIRPAKKSAAAKSSSAIEKTPGEIEETKAEPGPDETIAAAAEAPSIKKSPKESEETKAEPRPDEKKDTNTIPPVSSKPTSLAIPSTEVMNE